MKTVLPASSWVCFHRALFSGAAGSFSDPLGGMGADVAIGFPAGGQGGSSSNVMKTPLFSKRHFDCLFAGTCAENGQNMGKVRDYAH